MIPQEHEQAPQDSKKWIPRVCTIGPSKVGIYTKDNAQQILNSTHIQAKSRFD